MGEYTQEVGYSVKEVISKEEGKESHQPGAWVHTGPCGEIDSVATTSKEEDSVTNP